MRQKFSTSYCRLSTFEPSPGPWRPIWYSNLVVAASRPSGGESHGERTSPRLQVYWRQRRKKRNCPARAPIGTSTPFMSFGEVQKFLPLHVDPPRCEVTYLRETIFPETQKYTS